jgi:hypothetical protein
MTYEDRKRLALAKMAGNYAIATGRFAANLSAEKAVNAAKECEKEFVSICAEEEAEAEKLDCYGGKCVWQRVSNGEYATCCGNQIGIKEIGSSVFTGGKCVFCAKEIELNR